MAKKFVRGVTGIEDIESYDKTLTNVNDILSDGQDTYVHTKKGKTESYYKLTDGIKQVESSDNMLSITKEDGTISIANSGLATKEELTPLATKEELASKQDTLTSGVGLTIDNNQIDINTSYIKHYNNIVPNKLSDLSLLETINKANCSLSNGKLTVEDGGHFFPTIKVKGNEDVYISLFNISDQDKVTWCIQARNGTRLTEPVKFKGSSSDNVYYLDMSSIQNLTQNNDDLLQIRVDNRRVNQQAPENETLTIDQFMISKGGVPSHNSNDFECVYVDGSSSSNIENGTKQFPFKTIQRAINVNPKQIMIASGTYNENIIAMTKPSLKMTAIPPIFNHNNPIPDKPKVVITNGVELSLSSDNDDPTLLSASLTYKTNSRLDKVFVSKTMSLTETNNFLSVGYNVIIWEHAQNQTTRLIPVIDLSTCLSTKGSFTYDGTKLYVNPSSGADSKFIFTDARTYKQNERLAYFSNIGELVLEGIDFKYSYDSGVYINQCDRVIIKDCESSYSALFNGFATVDSNADFENCKAYFNRADGFNHHGYGNVLVNECFGLNNFDDGCSHHDGTTGTIVGGEYAYNGKGGIAPTYGCDVYVKDVYSHNNKYGCYLMGRDTDKFREVIHKGNVFIDNTTYDYLIANNYNVKGINNRYTTIEGSNKYVTI